MSEIFFEEKILGFKPQMQLEIEGLKQPISISFEWKSNLPEDDKITKDEVEAAISEWLKYGYTYLIGILGAEVNLGTRWGIELTNRKKHAAAGIDMKLSLPSIIQSIKNRNENRWADDYQRATFTHEILHSETPEEHLPMFFEMICAIENGHPEWIEWIRKEFLENKFAAPYNNGLKKISQWLKFDSVDEMLLSLPKLDLTHLKEVAKTEFYNFDQENWAVHKAV